jgi:phosphoribosylformimino-5-aminoimidazole carboxamide ribonucleotide (ProFAR) isomerase
MIEMLDAAGCGRYIVTDVAKDGTLTGPNFELLKEVCAVTKAPVVASGGISVLQDLIDLRELTKIGIEGAIVGKALYSGSFTLKQALEVAGK